MRGLVEELGRRASDPAYVLTEINRSLLPIVERTGQPVFATVFFGVIDLTTNKLCFANAGHPPPLVRRRAGETIIRLAPDDPEPATGLLHEFPYSRHECDFSAGDLLLGYTDGILEATNESGQMFGELGLETFLGNSRGVSTDEICAQLIVDVERHSHRHAFDDDVCIVAIEAAATR